MAHKSVVHTKSSVAWCIKIFNIIFITIFNENTSVRNQTICVLFITIYTALHVSAYMQAIFRCYPTARLLSSVHPNIF
jgi:hypothetical protein